MNLDRNVFYMFVQQSSTMYTFCQGNWNSNLLNGAFIVLQSFIRWAIVANGPLVIDIFTDFAKYL